MSRVIVSFDIESDGKLPNANMWELGVVAFDAQTKKEVGALDMLINTRQEIQGDPDTLDWIVRNNLDTKYQQCVNRITHSPETAMNNLYLFLVQLQLQYEKIEFVASPSAYDFPYLAQYYVQYGPQTPEGQKLMPYKATCISSIFNHLYPQNRGMWEKLANGKSHTHHAVDDAREQGTVYLNLPPPPNPLYGWIAISTAFAVGFIWGKCCN
jgi:hypothetical protein